MSNIVPFPPPPPPASPEALAEFERQAREHFKGALILAVKECWEDPKRKELGNIGVSIVGGIMTRALDSARVDFGWL